ncbi:MULTISPECIES: aldo/keto reductase [unclassified Microbacterium]|uniref:aldo/keto reductase n=1 Tax=unclassified Microbacterium TaxID=2609290 RepID=UPI00214B6847|nr:MULTISPECIES: aldo/keto reductase [unclassified Microbacterium]MCR2786028.1 aldo/keto reductase [Microbacterium sp. zg.B96]MDL5352951.1 aldo/keto reductase [Microbacterium sp. zg-YB36]WIM16939.1 aldo/keto reductase [Microbacterium sp. zg-B96]
MGLFSVGSASASPRLASEPRAPHPSAPIPVQGPPLGRGVRTVLGESGLSVFPLIVGGAEFGWHVDLESSHAILDAYVELGGNAVHTSDAHSSGRSEHIIGQWIHSRGLRDDLVVAVRIGAHPDHPGLGPVNLVRAVESSLTRLRTDRIDMLYLDGDADGGGTALEDALATVEWLIEAGKVRALGVFGFTAPQLVEARILSSAGLPRVTALDVPYNLLRRDEFEGDLRLVAGAQGIAVTPSQALAHGFLSGRHRSRARAGASVRGAQLAASMNRRGTRMLRAVDALGTELGVSDAAVALAWLLAQKTVVAPIVNVYSPTHVEELVQGVGVKLGRSQLAELARAAG